MTYRNVNTKYVRIFLVYNGINRNRRFTCLSVTDYKFSLTSADRYHRVNRLYTRLQRHAYRLTFDNSRRRRFDGACFGCIYCTLAVNRVSESVNNTPQKCITNGNVCDTSRTFCDTALFYSRIITENNNADVIFFKVQRHRHNSAVKLYKLTGHTRIKSVYTCNSVTDFYNITRFCFAYYIIVIFNSVLYNFA